MSIFFEDNEPQRRRTDRHGWKRYVRANAYRDIWLLIITGVTLLALWTNHTTLVQQQKGRHFAVGVTCAVISAVSEAGQRVISGSSSTTAKVTPFERALERLGYPPRSTRIKQARIAGRLYVQHIASEVQSQVGGRGARLVRANGTIDCQRLQRFARTATAAG